MPTLKTTGLCFGNMALAKTVRTDWIEERYDRESFWKENSIMQTGGDYKDLRKKMGEYASKITRKDQM